MMPNHRFYAVPLLFLLCFSWLCACKPAESPQSRDPGAIKVEAQLGEPLLLANGDSTVYAVIRISTVAQAARARGPVNVALAIDTSGSMEGPGIVAARSSALQVIDALADGDRLAVVVFHSRAEVLLPSTELDAEVRADIRKRISAMEARGTTEMAGGLRAALDQVLAHFDAKGINRVVLLGDGVPNKAADIEYTAKRAAGYGVAITSLGLGLDYDEVLMGKIADLSGGRYQFVEDASKLAGFFRQELERMDTVYARAASASLVPGPGVRIDAVVGTQLAEPGSATRLPIGDIARGDSRDIVVRMTVTPRKPDVPIELLDVVVTFDDALADAGRLERQLYLGARTTLDAEAVAKAHVPAVDLAAAIAEASATTLRALELSKAGQFVQARAMLQKGAEAALAQTKRTPSAELEKLADNMKSVASDMPEVNREAPKPSSSAGSYEFTDDAVSGEMVVPQAAEAPSVVRQRKATHQRAMDALH